MPVRTVEGSAEAGSAQAGASLLSLDELRAALRAVGEERYHHKHPFHLMMHEGRLSRGQLQAWALNRYYYQSIIPIKDSIILSRGTDVAFRRAWRKRVVDHDGDATSGNDGGIKRWLKLAEAAGLNAEQVRAGTGILPATRFAVNEYLNIVRSRSLLEAVASSLTELFSRDLISLRMEKMRQHYPWLTAGLDYFQARLTQAPEDAKFATEYVYEHAKTRAEQELAIQALRDKCDILWAQLDALYFAYVQPGWPPPGAFRIEEA
ncbi:MAG TPA: pyrroloquinoline-quinone synthase PqqC [Candidatus Sulfotelmatobacter sp.]|nr:pyrroloquinoline-quinone synthase PqqC [Candidatus Sulfotelmatobacter sp.]